MKPAPKPITKYKLLAIVKDIMAIGGIYIFAQIIAILAIQLIDSSSNSESISAVSIITGFITAGTIMGAVLYLYVRSVKIRLSSLLIKKPTIGALGYAVVGFLLYLFLTVISSLVLQLIPGFDTDQKQDLGLDGIQGSLLPLAFVALVIVPPIVEEFMFRGYLYQRFQRFGVSKVISAFAVSALFGIVHGQPNVAVDTFLLSLVMIFMLEKSKNLWTTVLIHALKNTLAFLVLFVFKLP